MKKFLKFLFVFLGIVFLCIVLYIIFSDDETAEQDNTINSSATSNDEVASDDDEEDTLIDGIDSSDEDAFSNDSAFSEGETWAIYWYLCGSDLESEEGAATDDLEEMFETELPENVKVVIETGGAASWKNDYVDSTLIERYLYEGNELTCVDQQPSANMGDTDTFREFLQFCEDNYSADHKMILFWNHGGGSVNGVAFDELYDYDSLTLDEMHEAYSNVYELSSENPPMEIVGFDTCLMATVDTASSLTDVSHYMVASEEMEPGNGWYYSEWLQQLADNPTMNGAQLGKVICDTYVEGCELEETGDDITLSVIDLSRMEPLLTAYDNIGKEALGAACEDPVFLSELARNTRAAENYGGNSSEEGYTNMVDLGDFVSNSATILPENANDVLTTLEDCVIYKINGPYRAQATGLSCYYSYNNDAEDYEGYMEISASEAFKYLYGYEINGAISDEGMKYLEQMGYEELPEIQTIATNGLDDFPIELDDDGYAVLDIGTDTANMLQAVYFQLSYYDAENDLMILLGRDNDLDADWENGVFKDNFRGVWGSIDGHLVYMEITDEKDDYNIYSVPVILNGEDYNLRVTYDYSKEAYEILGARKEIDDVGMADKEMKKIVRGDKITTILYAAEYSDDESEYTATEGDTFTVTDTTKFEEIDLGDGEFYMIYEMVDMSNESAYSDIVTFYVEGDEVTTEVYE